MTGRIVVPYPIIAFQLKPVQGEIKKERPSRNGKGRDWRVTLNSFPPEP
jgi:hypothetical protein